MSKLGVIGGSGLYNMAGFTLKKKKKISTPFGNPSEQYLLGEIGNNEVIFLPRHGKRHDIPPHMINYFEID